MDPSILDPNQRLLRELFHRDADEHARKTRADLERRVSDCFARLSEESQVPETYIDLAACCERLNRHEEAVEVLQKGVNRCPLAPRLYYSLFWQLIQCNQVEKAIQVAEEASHLFPDDPAFLLRKSLALPLLYETPEAVEYYAERFRIGLEEVFGAIDLGTTPARKAAFRAIKGYPIFDLAYSGLNILALQRRYGELVTRIMSINYPQWSIPLPMPPISPDGQLRIGYVSAHFSRHSVTKIYLGWLRHHDRTRFRLHAYSLGLSADKITDEVRQIAAAFWQHSGDFEATCSTILRHRLHVLIYLDVGMDPIMAQLAALRLAPIQCVTWGHPVTSGLPALDYYLSSELMEPKNGEEHYSEQLIRLPGIGVHYRKPVVPTAIFDKSRSDFGIRKDAVVYLSCQSVFKYLPIHDSIFADIACRVPEAQFVFLVPNLLVQHDFARRLDRAFLAKGIESKGRCVFIPALDTFRYLNLNTISDVYLDTLEWSGFNTTMEAIACGLPVVTLPGRFMRGRHSYAILAQLGVTETIARDLEGYVSIARRLGLDPALRERIVERMSANYPRLYSDSRSVQALEDFYSRIVRAKLA